MGKLIIMTILLSICLNAKESNIYETNCMNCHYKLPVSLDKYFYRYLLKYSSEREVKSRMYSYLKNPTKEKTIMPEAFIVRFGVKKKTKLSDKKLKNALDIYWDKYKVYGKLK